MTTAKFILLVLLSLPPHYLDKETIEERTDRMTTIATAVDAVSARATCSAPYDDSECKRVWLGSQRELALLLVTKAWWESRLARHVQEGNCRKNECDATQINGVIVHRARTIWQMQRTGVISNWEWDNMVGVGSVPTYTAAWVAARILSRGKTACKTTYGTISYYAVGRCDWPPAARRYMLYEKLSKKTSEQLKQDAERYLAAPRGSGKSERAAP